jgi:hypothetical protein
MNRATKNKMQKLEAAGAIDPYKAAKNLKLKGKRKTDGNEQAKRVQKGVRNTRKEARKTRKENAIAARNKYANQMMAILKVRYHRKSQEKKDRREQYGRGTDNKD